MELPLTSHNNMEFKSQQNNSYLMQKIFNLATQLKEPDKSQITTIENFCHGYNLTEPNVTFRLKYNCAAYCNRFENGFYRNKPLLQVF